MCSIVRRYIAMFKMRYLPVSVFTVIVALGVQTVVSTPIIRDADAVLYAGYKLYRTRMFPVQLPVVDSLDSVDGIEIWNWIYYSNDSSYQMDVLASPRQVPKVEQILAEEHLNYNVVIDDLQTIIEKENFNESPLLDNRFGHPMTWASYHSFEDMAQYMHYLEQTYPGYVMIDNLGKSFENRSLFVARVLSPLNNSTKRPGIWVDGGMHAREWVSPAVVSYFLHRLVENSGEYKDVIDFFDWYIMPVANPDGYEYSRSHDRLWLKTRSVLTSTEKCIGVDMNRNFGYMWNYSKDELSACSAHYSGPDPFSESETRAIRDYLFHRKDQIKVYISVHAYKQVLMYPWGYTKAPLNSARTKHAAHVTTQAINSYARSEMYHHGRIAELLYEISGSSSDFVHGELGIPYSFTLDLRDRGDLGFMLPKEQIEPTAEESFVGLIAMAREVLKVYSESEHLPQT